MKPEKVFIYLCNSSFQTYNYPPAATVCLFRCWSGAKLLEFIRAQVPASITTFPSSAQIVPEPLGVVLIISAWNYPFSKLIDSKLQKIFFPPKQFARLSHL
jgi:hypothetical protein